MFLWGVYGAPCVSLQFCGFLCVNSTGSDCVFGDVIVDCCRLSIRGDNTIAKCESVFKFVDLCVFMNGKKKVGYLTLLDKYILKGE